ncbi:hypothetical protein PWEIH_14896 [Listeria weihenstephanensis FSL R9-0317]|uniref:Uncharacterized protein n=1 Tax=Listeria weihenstephanensis TaxID=1006155 RepID=A0A1S7FVK6_9LIST|nr:hypothetical protein [Listeria weihenstephanensis]AQY51481.1 hypothetical protein UE46_10830 [Listeria weihenstephanensis]EUJ35841.1 hypothetical protein PWEIH_14896 [Listeria weihenstephanensis FSL R9-0317]
MKIALDKIEFHETPLEKVSMEAMSICVALDDVTEKRCSIRFSPFQAFRITTVDCVLMETFLIDGRKPAYLLEDVDSSWIRGLKKELNRNDGGADFLDKAHHYVFAFQDNVIEIVAWGFEVEEVI